MNWIHFKDKYLNWERWPFVLRYLPIVPVWIWYCIRARSFWFFTPSNPTLTFGGFEGEDKREMYEQLDKTAYPKTCYIKPSQSFQSVLQEIEKGFDYPFCVKPDVGMKGLLFRKIDNEEQLLQYHSKMKVEYLVQELVNLPLEVSIFYYRFPNEKKGVISGFIQKDLMDVMGDGNSTLRELIEGHAQAKHRMDEMEIKHQQRLHSVLDEGERYILTHAANLNRGARFSDLQQYVNDELVSIFDGISHRTSFYYGRYDLKCADINALSKGDFIILEFNGSGAEPNHVYHTGYSWFRALSVILRHWKALYRISRINYQQGIRYWEFKKGLLFLRKAKKHLRLLEELDKEIIV